MLTPSRPILLHGFTGSSSAWGDRIVHGLADAGLEPDLVDLPGHGRNASVGDSKQFTLAATLGDLAESGSWPTALVGYSMGGRVALHFAAAFPNRVQALVLEAASPGLHDEEERGARREADDALARRLEEDGLDRFLDFWDALPLFETRTGLDRSVADRHQSVRAANDPGGLARALRGLGTGVLPSLWERLGEIRVPTLLLVGGLDSKFVALNERMAALLPDARLEVVEGAGHSVHLERPDAWLGAVVPFLLGVSGRHR